MGIFDFVDVSQAYNDSTERLESRRSQRRREFLAAVDRLDTEEMNLEALQALRADAAKGSVYTLNNTPEFHDTFLQKLADTSARKSEDAARQRLSDSISLETQRNTFFDSVTDRAINAWVESGDPSAFKQYINDNRDEISALGEPGREFLDRVDTNAKGIIDTRSRQMVAEFSSKYANADPNILIDTFGNHPIYGSAVEDIVNRQNLDRFNNVSNAIVQNEIERRRVANDPAAARALLESQGLRVTGPAGDQFVNRLMERARLHESESARLRAVSGEYDLGTLISKDPLFANRVEMTAADDPASAVDYVQNYLRDRLAPESVVRAVTEDSIQRAITIRDNAIAEAQRAAYAKSLQENRNQYIDDYEDAYKQLTNSVVGKANAEIENSDSLAPAMHSVIAFVNGKYVPAELRDGPNSLVAVAKQAAQDGAVFRDGQRVDTNDQTQMAMYLAEHAHAIGTQTGDFMVGARTAATQIVDRAITDAQRGLITPADDDQSGSRFRQNHETYQLYERARGQILEFNELLDSGESFDAIAAENNLGAADIEKLVNQARSALAMNEAFGGVIPLTGRSIAGDQPGLSSFVARGERWLFDRAQSELAARETRAWEESANTPDAVDPIMIRVQQQTNFVAKETLRFLADSLRINVLPFVTTPGMPAFEPQNQYERTLYELARVAKTHGVIDARHSPTLVTMAHEAKRKYNLADIDGVLDIITDDLNKSQMFADLVRGMPDS